MLDKLIERNVLNYGYRFNTSPLLQEVRKALKWSDGKAIKNKVDIQLLDQLDPRTEADVALPPEAGKQPKAKDNGKLKSSKKGETIKLLPKHLSKLPM